MSSLRTSFILRCCLRIGSPLSFSLPMVIAYGRIHNHLNMVHPHDTHQIRYRDRRDHSKHGKNAWECVTTNLRRPGQGVRKVQTPLLACARFLSDNSMLMSCLHSTRDYSDSILNNNTAYLQVRTRQNAFTGLNV